MLAAPSVNIFHIIKLLESLQLWGIGARALVRKFLRFQYDLLLVALMKGVYIGVRFSHPKAPAGVPAR
jgi:hypothetical protein